MARLKNGILGGLTGKIGDVEAYIRNGIAYIRAKRRKSKYKPSIKQLQSRKMMSVVNKFINSMTPFVRIGFERAAAGKPYSANNAAKSYQLNNSLRGIYPDITIDYSAVRLTEGNVDPPRNLQVRREKNHIGFTWDYDAQINWNDQRAQIMVLAYSPELEKSQYLMSGDRMNNAKGIFELSKVFKKSALHVYVSFVSDDRKDTCNSLYMGLLEPII